MDKSINLSFLQRFRNSEEKLGTIGEERQRLEGVERKVVQGKVDKVFRLLVFRH